MVTRADPAHRMTSSVPSGSSAGKGASPAGAEQLAQAVALLQSGQSSAAMALVESILAQQPGYAAALDLLSYIAFSQGDLPRVVALLNQAVQQQPNNPAFFANRGLAHQALGQHAQAVADFDAALRLQPDLLQAHANRGASCLALGQAQAALHSWSQASALAPNDAALWRHRGRALKALGRLEEALACHDRALTLQPDFAEAHNSRGIVLKALGRLDDAWAAYQQALALQPTLVDAYTNLGVLHTERGALDQALAAYDQALALRPDDVDAAWNKANFLLLTGQLAQGWALYEQRWRRGLAAPQVRPAASPRWQGTQALQGKTLLVMAEQGLGDTIQFCRFVPEVAALGARVILERPAALAGLLEALPGVAQAIDPTEPRPASDFHCPLMSLPLALGTTWQTLPAPSAYLQARADKRAHWAAVLGHATRPRVGLVWRGNPRHGQDLQRSLPLPTLLSALPDHCDYVSLQKDVPAQEQTWLAQDARVRDLGPQLQDFTDTAALCALMDVVISVDTSVAHLAGALGCPTWVLLPHVPDWRWLLARSDSPWYPRMRLFRQGPERHWTPVLQAVAEHLGHLARPAQPPSV